MYVVDDSSIALRWSFNSTDDRLGVRFSQDTKIHRMALDNFLLFDGVSVAAISLATGKQAWSWGSAGIILAINAMSDEAVFVLSALHNDTIVFQAISMSGVELHTVATSLPASIVNS